MKIREMKEKDWKQVAKIYQQGIDSKKATFETQLPDYKSWDESHLMLGRLVAENKQGEILGWVVLSQTSSRFAYRGVCEVSIYIKKEMQGQGIGKKLLKEVVKHSEENGVWMLQSVILSINKRSIQLHEKVGFRMVGYREKVAQDGDGRWQDTVLMERRSNKEKIELSAHIK